MTKHLFDHEKLDVYQLELSVIAWLADLFEETKNIIGSRLSETLEQLDRASLSMLLNTAEGNGKRIGQLRARFFDDSRGSATECGACLDALVAKRACSSERIEQGKAMLVRVVLMLTKLIDRFDATSGAERAASSPSPSSSLSRRKSFSPAFTLVEIVIVMTILAVLAAASVPSFRGFQREREARAPLVALVEMAKEARLRAMREKRPYQVALTATGFSGTRYFDPYLTVPALEEYVLTHTPLEELAAPEPAEDEPDATAPLPPAAAPGISDTAAASPDTTGAEISPLPPEPEWISRQSWPTGAAVTAQVWHDISHSSEPIAGEQCVLWVFQPSGICEPMVLTLVIPGGELVAEFGSLSADIVRETSTF